jgi:hypothetical protein
LANESAPTTKRTGFSHPPRGFIIKMRVLADIRARERARACAREYFIAPRPGAAPN